ncbi:MAG: tetratricopeptide repeat protein [Proteobacteria bacterium]|nr:MAG: tetratricopeptide repeat protein [Pseudomonadota bacterium]
MTTLASKSRALCLISDVQLFESIKPLMIRYGYKDIFRVENLIEGQKSLLVDGANLVVVDSTVKGRAAFHMIDMIADMKKAAPFVMILEGSLSHDEASSLRKRTRTRICRKPLTKEDLANALATSIGAREPYPKTNQPAVAEERNKGNFLVKNIIACINGGKFEVAMQAIEKLEIDEPLSKDLSYLKSYMTFKKCQEVLSLGSLTATATSELKEIQVRLKAIPRDSEWYASSQILLGKVSLKLGDSSEALKAIEESQLNMAYPIRRLIALGDVYLEKNLFDQARLKFQQALNLDPTNELAKIGITRACMEGGDKSKSNVDLQNPEIIVSQLNTKAVLLSKLGKASEAIRIFQKILKHYATEQQVGKVCYNMSLAYLRLGETDLAVKALERCILRSGESQKARSLLSRVLAGENPELEKMNEVNESRVKVLTGELGDAYKQYSELEAKEPVTEDLEPN